MINTEKGIILIATGSPMYGRLAYNLAVTIKAVEKIPVIVLTNGAALNHLSDERKRVFDEIIQIPEQAFAAKLNVYDYSPFDETIYLDADMVWLPKKTPTEFFNEMKPLNFAAITEGFYDYETGTETNSAHYHFWCNPIEAKEKYGLEGMFYQWRSELMYFRKCDEVKAMFDMAREIQATPKVEYKKFGTFVPDELGINIAACKLGIHPHVRNWRPAYWHRLHGEGKPLHQIMNECYLMSVGGNFATGIMKLCYNKVVSAAHKKLGLQYLFPLQSKRSTIPERQKM